MSVTVKTYILYGTIVDVYNYDRTKFEDDMDYINYLYDVVNKDDSPYQIIFNEDKGEYHFGYVIDEASDGSWDNKYLSSQSFEDITNAVTTDVKQALDWMLLLHFNTRSNTSKIGYSILTVYC